MTDPKRNRAGDPVHFSGYSMFADDQYYVDRGGFGVQQSAPPSPPPSVPTTQHEQWVPQIFNTGPVPDNHQAFANGYGVQNQLYREEYPKHTDNDLFMMNLNLGNRSNLGMPDFETYPADLNFPTCYQPNESPYLLQDIVYNAAGCQQSNCNPLIDNVVGNWTPSTGGTYSPFGNVPNSNNLASIFTTKIETNLGNLNANHRSLNVSQEDEVGVQKEQRKGRVADEVKSMRPTYSDVLLKSMHSNVNAKQKVDLKDVKQKKETKRNLKNEKAQKVNGTLSRSNTNNEIKDIPTEKSQYNLNSSSKMEKNPKENRTSQLNRKWVSLDDVSDNFNHIEEIKNKKVDDNNKHIQKQKNAQKNKQVNKSHVENTDTDSGTKCDYVLTKSVKRTKNSSRQKNHNVIASEQNNKRQRGKKRDSQASFDVYKQKVIAYLKNWWKYCVGFILWLFTLVSDICNISWHISRDGLHSMWTWTVIRWSMFKEKSVHVIKQIGFLTWIHEKFKRSKEKDEKRFARAGLQTNISMPQTGDEAMRRLLACKGKDPYSILGVTSTCTDDDIKRYYKKQAVLVHPDKNKQPGAEEAFKILVHAFDMIGEPERRAAYDKGVAQSAQEEQAWTELTELLAQFQEKVEAAAKTIRCSYCGAGHKRKKIERPTYAARNCNNCRIFHAAREGDIWAEASWLGLFWSYFACMDGGVYDITEWAGCQKSNLKQMKPDSHNVQYRIALGKSSTSASSSSASSAGGKRQQPRHATPPPQSHPPPPSSADDPTNLENLLNKIYGQQADAANATRNGRNNRNNRNNKKFK